MQHAAIGGEGIAGAYDNRISHGKLLHRHDLLTARRAKEVGVTRAQAFQAIHGGARAQHTALFQEVSQGDEQRHQDRRRIGSRGDRRQHGDGDELIHHAVMVRRRLRTHRLALLMGVGRVPQRAKGCLKDRRSRDQRADEQDQRRHVSLAGKRLHVNPTDDEQRGSDQSGANLPV